MAAPFKYIVSSPNPRRTRFRFALDVHSSEHFTAPCHNHGTQSDSQVLNTSEPTTDPNESPRNTSTTNPNASLTKNPTTTLPSLPNEILVKIFSHLNFASQISLGLTCKSLGSVLEIVDLNWMHRVFDIYDLLKIHLADWMPSTYKYCVQCDTYVALAKGLWKSEWDCLIAGKALEAVMYWVDISVDNPYVVCTRCFRKMVAFYRDARDSLRRIAEW